MDREKFLEKLFPLIGGKENTSLCEFQDGVLYVTLKDAGLSDENAVAKLPDVASATLRRGRLTVTFGEPERKEEVPFMANKNTDYRALAAAIVEAVGGKENITSCVHCVTRLRFNLKDLKKSKSTEEIGSIPGTVGCVNQGGQLQVIIGQTVADVYAEVCSQAGLDTQTALTENLDAEKKKWSPKVLFDVISSVFVPAVPAFAGAGIIKGLLTLFTTYGLMSNETGLYLVLNAIGDSVFYFLPFIIAYTAAKKFKTNEVLALVLAGLYMYPSILNNAGNSISGTYLSQLIETIGDRDFSVNVISKSGTTTEPAIAFRIFKEMLENKYGKEEAACRIYATTDRAKGALKGLATEEGYETFVVPDDVGGRFSVLTAVGLLPIAASGADIEKLMEGARSMRKLCLETEVEKNDAIQYALIRNILHAKGKSVEVLANYEPIFHYVGEWWKQLYGESEGKDQKGIFPAAVFSLIPLI